MTALTHRQQRVLELIHSRAREGEHLEMAALAAQAGVSPAVFKVLVKGLVRLGALRAAGSDRVEVADPPQSVEFTVLGRPRPQGSKVAFVTDDGRAQMLESGHEGLDDWRELVCWAARKYHPVVPIDGPVEVDITFYLRRPKQPKWQRPARRPDLDKLERAVHDALTIARVIGDDGQITDSHTRKRWALEGASEGAEIRVRRIAEDEMAGEEAAG